MENGTKKKTIALTIDRGMVVRNLVNSIFFEKLKAQYNVIVLTPLYKDQSFIDHLGSVVAVEPLREHTMGAMERIFFATYKSLIYNPTVHVRSRYGFQYKTRAGAIEAFKFWLTYVIFGLGLSKIKILRKLWRYLDKIVFTNDYYNGFFTKYDVDAVFISNIHFRDEVYFLKSARKRSIHSIGMTKSWDNFSKDGYRAKVDTLVVWNAYMMDEAMEYQGYRKDEIKTVGVPQFDIYSDGDKTRDKKEFAEVYGLDVRKKTILFGQESKDLSPDDPEIVKRLRDWIRQEQKEYQILIRPHFAHQESVEVFNDLIDNETVFIDKINAPSGFRDEWDYSIGHHRRLMLSMVCSDVVVTSVSTLILDAIAGENEVVAYVYDAEEVPFKDSIKRLLGVLWLTELYQCGMDEFMAHDDNELTSRIEGVLEGSVSTSAETKQRIIDRFMYKCDGKSGERLFEVVSGVLA